MNDGVLKKAMNKIGAIWPLVSLSSWFIDFLGKVMRDSVVFGQDDAVSESEKNEDEPTPRKRFFYNF
jgi:hypothetical protein